MQDQPLPPNICIWQLGLGFANTNVLYALVKSGVTEQLRDASNTLEQLADACNLNAGVLFRVLRYATGTGVVSLKDDQYALTETGKFLLDDVPGSIYGGLMLMGTEPWRKSWNNLIFSMQTGESAFTHTMGGSFFEYLQAHPDHAAMFNNWMTANSMMVAAVIPESYDFSPFKTICDIGGGQGLLLRSILSANPHLHGILYDMENVVQHHVLDSLNGRVTIKAGNFFESVPQADFFLMKSIIHDWNDEEASRILNTCKKVMDAGTKLLIIERVLEENADVTGLFFDLHMQVMVGGRERSAKEFEDLLHNSGLKLNRIIPTQLPVKIIEASL